MKPIAASRLATVQKLARWSGLFAVFAGAWWCTGLWQRQVPDVLATVRSNGVLRVAALARNPYCFRNDEGLIVGLECDPLRGFAHSIGAKFQAQLFDNEAEVVDAVRSSQADIGAGGIDRLPSYRRFVAFGPTVRQISEQLIYNRQGAVPLRIEHLDGDLLVVADSPASAALESLHARIPSLDWEETREDDATSLIEQVADGDLDYTIADSDLAVIMLQRFPQLRIAFDLGEPRERVWALPRSGADTLAKALAIYLDRSGPLELRRLEDQYLGHIGHMLSYDDAAQFADDIEELLPRWRKAFVAAGIECQIDWRLLAAIGYQESHWDNQAVSRTGVRGIMMLTSETAERLEVRDRGNAQESIMGAARYLAELRDSMPQSITEPDRSWFALAAYNIGLSHLQDARSLTTLRGGSSDLWRDVRKSLPLLARSAWYTRVSHGQARGGETVIFVANVRAYYDILSWMEGGSHVAPISSNEAVATATPRK
jgi:membrane-bound lytic murein transglycosylase F